MTRDDIKRTYSMASIIGRYGFRPNRAGFISIDKVADAAVPDMSETRAYKNHLAGYNPNAIPAGDGFMNIPDGIDEELPFN